MKTESQAQVRVNLVNATVERIFPNPWNPNEQSDFIFEKERRSIRVHGFLDPILVREIPEGYEIIDGEHRWKAAQAEGLTMIPANNLGKVSDAVAKQLTVIMNETRGEARRDKLGELLQGLRDEVGVEELYANLPYQSEEIDSLINQTAIDWDAIGDGSSADAGASGDSVEGEEDFRTVTFRLPEGVADQLEDQIRRLKKALHPDEDPESCSPVQAIEAICQHIAQIDQSQLV